LTRRGADPILADGRGRRGRHGRSCGEIGGRHRGGRPPLDRNDQSEDIAAAFLLSVNAAFISGQRLVVDDGWIAARYRAQPEG